MKKELGIIASTICVLLAASCSANNAQSTNTAATVSAAAETIESAVTSTEVTEDTTTTTTTAETTTTTTTTTTAATTTTTVTTEEPFVVETVIIAGEQYQTDVLELDLSGKHLTDDDLTNLAKCKKLVSLNLYDVSIDSDYMDRTESFVFLENFTDLEKLTLPAAVDFDYVKDLTNLQYLRITSTEMVMFSYNLNNLRNLKSLKELDLGGMNDYGLMTAMMGDGTDLSVFKRLENLEVLSIYDGYFSPYETEKQIEVFCSLKSLKKLYVGNMSEANKQKIQEALPDCVIGKYEF